VSAAVEFLSPRPVYETTDDRGREHAVAQRVAEAWRCEVREMPPKAPYDYCAVRDGLIAAICEIKVRNNTSTFYPSLMISVDKLARCDEHARVIGCPFLIIVQYTDALRWVRFSAGMYTAGIGGRTDRADRLDIEPVVFIPCESFRNVNATAKLAL